jgi:ComB9 competence protein
MFVLIINASVAVVLQQQSGINSYVNQQLKGDYGNLKRPHVPLGIIQHAWDENIGGVYEIDYKSNEVIKIRLREHMITTIKFPSWEKINKILIGDQTLIDAIKPKQNIVVLYPLEYIGVDTSISILGDGYTYLFYARIEGYESKNIPDLGVNIRAYPPYRITNKTIKSKKSAKDYLEQSITKPEDLDFNFSMSGNKDIAPKVVYSDGIRTWLYYGKGGHKKRVPAVSLVLMAWTLPLQ